MCLCCSSLTRPQSGSGKDHRGHLVLPPFPSWSSWHRAVPSWVWTVSSEETPNPRGSLSQCSVTSQSGTSSLCSHGPSWAAASALVSCYTLLYKALIFLDCFDTLRFHGEVTTYSKVLNRFFTPYFFVYKTFFNSTYR